MEIQKTIETLEEMRDEINLDAATGKMKEIRQSGIEAINTAILVLEKQMPKKIFEDKNSDKKFDFMKCPNCKEIFHGNLKNEVKTIPLFKPLFCPFCGQALDWEVEECEED